jgi:hypothetical protein
VACDDGIVKTEKGASEVIDSHRATGGAMTVVSRVAANTHRVLKNVCNAVTLAARKDLWQQMGVCGQCHGRMVEGECSLCHGRDNVLWDGVQIPSRALQQEVIQRAGKREASQDGYLWLACQIPALANNSDVQHMIKTEVESHPAWALWGHAPDTLAQAGLGHLVVSAARACPEAARASLRASTVFCHK